MSSFNVFKEEISDSDSSDSETDVEENQEEIKKYTAPYKKIKDNVYIMQGKEKTIMNSERLVVYNNSKVSLFWGKCFMCGCVGHSQRFCPLKYCTKCQQYSHSVVTCNPNIRNRYNYRRTKYVNQRRENLKKQLYNNPPKIVTTIAKVSVAQTQQEKEVKKDGNADNTTSSNNHDGGEKVQGVPKASI